MTPRRASVRTLRFLHRAGLAVASVLLLALFAFSGMETLRAPPGSRAVGLALLAVEGVLGAFALALLASLAPREALAVRAPPAARVSILLPVANEEPDVLRETLAGVARLTWRDREAWVLDDSRDPARADAIREVALLHGARYVRREAPRGFKAGALNDALASIDAEFVLVLDVDHVPEPDAVERLLERFLDDRTAFVQGKLAWRNATSRFRRLEALLQTQFYEVLEREKEKRGTVVFAGSGACFRAAALRDVGGFPEETLVEDLDLTLALASHGWRGRFADAVVARGILPWTAADQLRQLWRWSAGTTRVLSLRLASFSRARRAPAQVRLELLLDSSAYLAAGLVPLAGAILLAGALLGAPVGPASAALTLLIPALLLAAHAGGAAVSLRRAGERVTARILSYHVVSLAFTPVLLASSVWGLVGGVGPHGRVSKVAQGGRKAGRSAIAVAGVTFALGCALLVASATFFADGRGAGVWAAELGIAFLLPLSFLMSGPPVAGASSA